jgi:hypothetical protein
MADRSIASMDKISGRVQSFAKSMFIPSANGLIFCVIMFCIVETSSAHSHGPLEGGGIFYGFAGLFAFVAFWSGLAWLVSSVLRSLILEDKRPDRS